MSEFFDSIKSIHFVGIKGVAMTALAILAKERGILVSGSDTEEVFPTDEILARFEIKIQKGFDASHLPNHCDLVIYTGAHRGDKNAEVLSAVSRGITILPHGKALGRCMEGKRAITVIGSHGKTTTSAMIAHMLVKLGKDPSYAVGCGEILSLGQSGHFGMGEFFIAEGDEYVTDPNSDPTPRFLWQKPEILVINNIDFDHPDVYKNLDEVKNAFVELADQVKDKGYVLVNTDDVPAESIIERIKRRIRTFGNGAHPQYNFDFVSIENGVSKFYLYHKNKFLHEFTLSVPGRHNIQNAVGAISALLTLGFAPHDLAGALTSFQGTTRRFQLIASQNKKLLYDDYAHHPAEITATLGAAKEWFPDKRLVVVFQPHTYSRTSALMNEFAHSLSSADQVVITDIYSSAREKPIGGVTGEVLYEKTKALNPRANFKSKKDDVLQYLKDFARPDDLILTLGAGDIYNWLPEMKEIL